MQKLVLTLTLLLIAGSALAHGVSDADRQDMIDGGNLRYIELGASHMVTGYDHLLFLLGVVFFLTRFRDIVKFITAFTIGHSITLIFATFLEITANYYLVDAVIALTVVYKGFDNLDGFRKVFKRNSPNLIMLVFIFGLIHGFGLSTRLQQLPLGDDGLLLRILSFNLGVELGQIAALVVMLAVLNLWRRSSTFARFSTAVNVGLVLAGIGLFVFQLSGYANEAPEEAATVEVTKEWRDEIRVTIPAGRGVEYKLAVTEGEALEYRWQAPVPLKFDFHGEAHDMGPDEFTSWGVGTAEIGIANGICPTTHAPARAQLREGQLVLLVLILVLVLC